MLFELALDPLYEVVTGKGVQLHPLFEQELDLLLCGTVVAQVPPRRSGGLDIDLLGLQPLDVPDPQAQVDDVDVVLKFVPARVPL